MARTFSEILKSVGIGVKSDYQKQRDVNPGMNQFKSRGGGADYKDIKQQEALNRQAGVDLERFQGRLRSGEKVRNINGISYVVPAASAAPAPQFNPQSYNPQVEGVQALAPMGMFTQLDQPKTTSEIVSKQLEELIKPDVNQQDVLNLGAMDMAYKGQGDPTGVNRAGAGFKSPEASVMDLRTGAQTINRPDEVADSFFKMNMIGEGAPDTAVLANVGDDGLLSQEDATKFGYIQDQSQRDRTGRSSGMNLLAGLLDIQGKAGADSPEQQARADEAEVIKNEILEKQFIAQELVTAGIIDRRQINNPVNVEKIEAIHKQRKEDPFTDNSTVAPAPTGRKGVVADLYEAANIIEPITDVTSAYQQNMVDADNKRAAENKSEGLFTSTEEQLRRFMAKRKEKEQKEMDAFDVNAAASLDPPAIVREVESRQARIVGEPVIEKAVDTIGFDEDEWVAYKQGIADIESSGGDYTVTSGQHLGKYQMNNDARADAAESMGIDNPSKKDFLANPKLQERMFAEYTRRNYLHLMQKSPEFRGMNAKEKYATLARAQLGAESLRKTLAGTSPDKVDSNKTKSSKFKDSVEKRLKQIDNNKGGFESTGEF